MLENFGDWIKKYKKYFFRYRKGFYELPYFANSPQTVNEGYKSAPFIKHDKDNSRFLVNNIFLRANTTFYNIEEGLWIYFLDIEHKKNIKFTPIFDDTINDNYYLFSLSEVRSNFKIKVLSERKNCYVDKIFWTLFKPLSNPVYLNNKNSSGQCITLYFNEAWLQKNILSHPDWLNSKVANFFNSSNELVSWPELSGIEPEKNFAFKEMLIKSKSEFSAKQLKTYTNDLIQQFFTALNNSENCYFYNLSNDDRDLIFKVEKYLLDNLSSDFEGIESLAKRFYISPTKLKASFKILYGTSIYQYFREKQMQLAVQLIKTEKFTIKDIALKLGYENASKFSMCLKSVFWKTSFRNLRGILC